MKVDGRLFVGNESSGEPLPPIFKGKKIKFYPGQMIRNTPRGKARAEKGAPFIYTASSKKSGLRRYIFRYENGGFVYLATRKGQRNGGFNSKPSQTTFTFEYSGPNNLGGTQTFSLSAVGNQPIYVESANSILQYDNAETRWEWTTRPSLTANFFLQAFSASTTNPLRTSTAANQVAWTYIEDPYNTATPQVPIVVSINPVQWFNNNTTENLNKWPIKNIDADYGNGKPEYGAIERRHWQKRTDTGTIVPDRRIDALSDEFLFRCFEGVNLKPYDIVFVEVVWRFRMNKADIKSTASPKDIIPNYRNSSWGYNESIHDYEWWSPKTFTGYTQKGRVYRIGKLETDTGINGYDKVIWAQRTRIVTTKWQRGGNTALE